MKSFEEAFTLKNKTAFITGGGTGLGLAMAKCIHAAGANVIIAGRRVDVLKNACSEIGERSSYYEFDVSETEKSQKVIDDIIGKFGRLDILVNNAGVQYKKPMEEMTEYEINHQFDVHLKAPYCLSQAVVPYMKKQKSGTIIFISSMSGFMGLTNVSAYGTAKAGVMGMVRSFASELSEAGIRVNAIVPGFIESPMFRKAMENDLQRYEKIIGRTPMKKTGSPEDIGWACVYLASEASAYVTGTQIIVDGGNLVGF